MFYLNFVGRFTPKGKIKKSYANSKTSYLNRIRWAISMFYFSKGLCFASWASRIPDIKSYLDLSEGQLGSILFAIPLGQLAIMPFSGKLVTKYGSHKVLLYSVLIYLICLVNIGLASSAFQLAAALFLFGVFANVSNIAVNTQGIYAEKLLKKNIMGVFHGTWSFAGFIGALIGLGIAVLQLNPFTHFALIASFVLVLVGFNYSYLIKAKDRKLTKKGKFFSKPDASLIWLGVIGFCSMASEGVMFDWSGVYFKEIVKAPDSLVILGYTSFMIMMAGGRFLGDKMTTRFGRKQVLQISGIMVSTGLLTAVIFPYIIPCVLAFMLVGLGVSTIVPTLYSVAGKSPTVAPGDALTIVSSVSFLGFLMGPPVIGHIAEAFGLQFSFAFIGIFGFLIAFMVTRVKAIQ
ncbi:MFS transporter [Flavobacterium sp. TMP13]|uniref:MFS transporter n=1 Tax=unclassified Flavobacterium TaxID=196869 RepID=UPI00076D88F0|nr:MFS transporter [Flavobacterium sp. TAB 87]KVV13576.1 Inner membrane protein YbjJ [Flavobacterium sp. TAB 87]